MTSSEKTVVIVFVKFDKNKFFATVSPFINIARKTAKPLFVGLLLWKK